MGISLYGKLANTFKTNGISYLEEGLRRV